MFETTGVIGERELQKIFTEMMPRWYRFMQIAPVLFLFALAAHATMTHSMVNAGVYLIFAMLFLTLSRGKIRSEAHRMMARMRKITGTDTLKYITRFSEDGIYTEAVGTKTAAVVPYNAIIRRVDTQDFTILFTVKNENIFIFRNQLTQEESEQMTAFLEKKVPALGNSPRFPLISH